MAAHVLVVDDDPAERRHIEEILHEPRPRGRGRRERRSGAGAACTRADAPPVSAMILDLVMPDIDGMAVLERLPRHALAVPVIVQTAPGGIDMGAAAIRAGAFDFLVKPATPERVRVSLLNALKIGALEGEILRMRLSRAGTLSLGDIVMHAPAMERVSQLAERAARSAIPVLIEGERGVGKELLARAIHGSGPRRSRPFVAVRCDGDGGISATTLFGARPRTPSPAASSPEAAGGTLFLDEIGALPADARRASPAFSPRSGRRPHSARRRAPDRRDRPPADRPCRRGRLRRGTLPPPQRFPDLAAAACASAAPTSRTWRAASRRGSRRRPGAPASPGSPREAMDGFSPMPGRATSASWSAPSSAP